MTTKRSKRAPKTHGGDIKHIKDRKDAPSKESPAKRRRKNKDAGAFTPRHITGGRLWLFRIVSIAVVPVLFLLLLELGLRMADYGYPADAMIRRKVGGEVVYCDNVTFCWRFFPKAISREFNPFKFSADKKENTYRIFVLGSSAAQGEPDGAFGFGRILQAMLRETYPAVNFEVIIAATAAINSHVVVEIARDCARHEPDLFVVYLGNNEVTGPYGAGTVFAPLSPSLSVIRMGMAFKATKLGQLLTHVVEWAGIQGGQVRSWRGLEMFLEKQIRLDDARLQIVYRHFRKNLEDIVRIGLDAGAHVVVSTVGGNLKDNPPFASLHRADMTDAERRNFDGSYRQGIDFEDVEDYTRALEQYLKAAEIDDHLAELHFRMGRCRWELGEYERSRQSFIQARELDTLRFRADNHINETICEVAANRSAEGVFLADAVKAFARNSPFGTPGRELFYEHVHLTFKGNYLLARTVFEKVDGQLPQWIKMHALENSLPLTEDECARLLAYTEWDRYVIADEVIQRFISKPPFTNQLYHQQQRTLLEQQRRDLKANLTPDVLKEAAVQYQQAIEKSPEDLYLRWKYGRLLAEELKHYKAAAEQFQCVKTAIPYSYVMYNTLGSIFLATRHMDAAEEHFLAAARIKPACVDAHYNLGRIYQQRGEIKKAIEHYSSAIRYLPNYVLAYNSLADVLYRQGKIDAAVEICRRGVMFVPDSALLHGSLGMLLHKQGRRDEAIKEIRLSLALDPNSTQNRAILEAVLKYAPD